MHRLRELYADQGLNRLPACLLCDPYATPSGSRQSMLRKGGAYILLVDPDPLQVEPKPGTSLAGRHHGHAGKRIDLVGYCLRQ